MGSLATAPRQGELELADRARSGDREALVQLYRRHREPLFRHAWRMLGEQAAAQDVVQEAFARAMVKVSETRPGLNFRAWIYRIATNLCLRELDRRGRARPDPDPDARCGEAVPASRPSMRREVGERLAAALGRLPDRYRQVLLLRELDELSYVELAQVLEVSEGNVKVLLHRARQRFAALFVADRLLEEPGAAEGCAELAQLARGGVRDALERHLERCERCRRLEHREAGELLALLPPAPAPALPDAPDPSAAGSGAAGGASAIAASSLVVGALVLGAVLLVAGAVVAAVSLLPSNPGEPRAATQRQPSNAPAASNVTKNAATEPHATTKTEGDAPASKTSAARSPDRHDEPTSTRNDARSRPRRRRPRGQERQTIAPQAVDPEAPPGH